MLKNSEAKIKIKNILIIFLIITLTYSNFVLIGRNFRKGFVSYAVENEDEQSEAGETESTVILNQELVTNKVMEDGKRIIQVAVETGIDKEDYIIKNTQLILAQEIINGATPEDIVVASLNKTSYTSGNWETRTMNRNINGEESSIDVIEINLTGEDEGPETKPEGLDKLLVTYILTEEENAENIEIKMPVIAFTTISYDNRPGGISKEELPSFEDVTEKGEILSLEVQNKDIHKTTFTEEGTHEYVENLKLDLSYRKDVNSIKIENTENNFYNDEETPNEEAKIKYVKTRIEKTALINLLAEDGVLNIKHKDENNEEKLLAQIAKSNTDEIISTSGDVQEDEQVLAQVTVSEEGYIEIAYNKDISNIIFEISGIKEQSNIIEDANFVIENTKSIYNVQNLDNLKTLKEKVNYELLPAREEGQEIVTIKSGEIESIINFKNTQTMVTLEPENATWEAGENTKVQFTITLDTEKENSEMFVNPLLVLELPECVTKVNAEGSEFTVTNDNGAFTSKRVYTATLLGKKYVVIQLQGEQTADSIINGNTNINLVLDLNIVQPETDSEKVVLYYRNDTVTVYENGNTFGATEANITITEAQMNEIVESEEEIIGENTARINTVLSTITDKIVKPGAPVEYILYVYNEQQEAVENVNVIDILPAGQILQGVCELVDDEEQEIDYSCEDGKITVALGTIEGATTETVQDEETGEDIEKIILGTRALKIVTTASTLAENEYSKEIVNRVKLQIGELTVKETECTNCISDVFLEVEKEDLPSEIAENDEITIKLNITNKGLIDAENISAKVILPEEIIPSNVKYGESEFTLDSNEYEWEIDEIEAGKTCTLEINGTIISLDETKDLNIKVTINGEDAVWGTTAVDNGEVPTTPETPTDPTVPSEQEEPTSTDPEKQTDGNEGDKKEENKKDEFDLSLVQGLSKVTVTTVEGTTTYEYKDVNFAKVEIPAKYMNGSTVTLEYNITVKNEGTIEGYARKIVDYIPEGLKFNSELNKDWYLGDDGNAYSVALIDKLLKPGDTANLKIILTKQMTNLNTGTIANIVEISEATNEAKAEDINSIPGDKLEGQNDMSKVEVIIAVRTGTIILYTMLAITIILIMTFGINKVRKVAINKKGGC